MKLKNTNINQVKEAKILGTIIGDDMFWNKKCENIVKKYNARMQLQRVIASFKRETVPSQTSDVGKKTLSVLTHSFLLP